VKYLSSILLILLLSSCAFIDKNNELKGRFHINLLFPLEIIGLSDLIGLPKIDLDILGGIEWHNDEYRLKEIELKNKLKLEENKQNEENIARIVANAFNSINELRDDKNSSSK
jgi:hypothetical protein